MVLYAAKNSTYREVVEVLDILRESGGDRVALATVPAISDDSRGNLPNVPISPGIPGVPVSPVIPRP